MKYGHRGPITCQDLETGRIYISSQNHGYEVLGEFTSGWSRDFYQRRQPWNLRGSITYRDIPAFLPFSFIRKHAGPKDTEELFGSLSR